MWHFKLDCYTVFNTSLALDGNNPTCKSSRWRGKHCSRTAEDEYVLLMWLISARLVPYTHLYWSSFLYLNVCSLLFVPSFLASLKRTGLSPRQAERCSAVHRRTGQSNVMLLKTAGCWRWHKIFWISLGLKGFVESDSAMVCKSHRNPTGDHRKMRNTNKQLNKQHASLLLPCVMCNFMCNLKNKVLLWMCANSSHVKSRMNVSNHIYTTPDINLHKQAFHTDSSILQNFVLFSFESIMNNCVRRTLPLLLLSTDELIFYSTICT